jgi:secondary thiamine-phosphate synthase enzyme
MTVRQYAFTLKPRPRGFHLATAEIAARLEELGRFSAGLCHLFLQHTSASLTLNENADPTVRADFEAHARRLVPDGAAYFQHTLEGPDDMSAHLKGSLFGAGLTVPISEGRLALGTWQGIYLCEHRDRGGPRRIVATLIGEVSQDTLVK